MEKFSELVSAFFSVLISALLLFSCANQIGPSGGEIDKIPPEVIEVYPADRSVNFNDDRIEIFFSEYVDKRSVQEAVFISPSVEGKSEYDWSGTSVEIVFEDSLKKNITYTVTVGTDVVDINNRNMMKSAYSFTFSTGPEIDFCSVKGKVHDKNPAGTFVSAYLLRDTIPNPRTQKPDYISQAGESGTYEILGMAAGTYRIFAIKDELRNLIYDTGDDLFGTPFRDVVLTKSDSIFINLNFILDYEDTTEANITEVIMTDMHHILIDFTEPVDTVKNNADNFRIIDSLNQKVYPVNFFYKGQNKGSKYFISLSDSISESEHLHLIVENVFDKKGNLNPAEAVSLVLSNKPDTTAPGLISMKTEYPGNVIDFLDPYMIVNYDDAVANQRLNQLFSFADDRGLMHEIDINKLDDATIKIIVKKSLKPKSEYKLLINSSSIEDAAGNTGSKNDTIRITTVNELEFSGLNGEVIPNDSTAINVHLINSQTNEIAYKQTLMTDFSFNFKRVRPGKYLLFAFEDKNKNNLFDKGSIDPFLYSERFIFYPDTLKLAARWPVGDVRIKFNTN
ncbi:MAG: Ig-like domain-containing protein [Melioribacteraceae bacterium]|nr:Ig-like domain-containing protein [Melioribacteraceae bacterium]